MHIGSLGDVVFEVGGQRMTAPASFSAEQKARFEEHQVLGAPPRLEFLAPELGTASLTIHLRADMGVNPEQEADRLRAMCVEGKAHPFIMAGRNYGNYVLEAVGKNILHVIGGGVFSLDLNLSLKEYV